MKYFILLIFIGSTAPLMAQKHLIKTIESTNISHLHIDTRNCFFVELETGPGPKVSVLAYMDGEYMSDLLLNLRQEASTLWIGAGLQPNFINPNDKLSAHKVISIRLKLIVPMQLQVVVNGNSSNLDVTGAYKSLKITLNDGHCNLENAAGEIKVTTQSGSIKLLSNGASIEAETKYGQFNSDTIPIGDSQFSLNSKTGDITIRKTE